LGAAIRIETDPAPDLWPAMVDPTQIELVVLNLAINARDAMPAGGRLTISTANVTTQDKRRPVDLGPGDYVAISVKDTGTGMTDAVLARAFEPFFTTKELGRGTGLGLSQVYGLAQQSGGRVTIETRLGSGTTINVFLPRAIDAAPQRRQRTGQKPRANQQGTVLVVDDDADVREIAVEALEGVGYIVASAGSGLEALDTIERGDTVDVVLIDYAMPEMNGLEAMRLISERRPATRIVLMTGHADVPALQTAAERARLLRKPFTVEQLTAAVTGDGG
jgi:CheY-like chemotaxis protein